MERLRCVLISTDVAEPLGHLARTPHTPRELHLFDYLLRERCCAGLRQVAEKSKQGLYKWREEQCVDSNDHARVYEGSHDMQGLIYGAYLNEGKLFVSQLSNLHKVCHLCW
jgi:hypothetical protein